MLFSESGSELGETKPPTDAHQCEGPELEDPPEIRVQVNLLACNNPEDEQEDAGQQAALV